MGNNGFVFCLLIMLRSASFVSLSPIRSRNTMFTSPAWVSEYRHVYIIYVLSSRDSQYHYKLAFLLFGYKSYKCRIQPKIPNREWKKSCHWSCGGVVGRAIDPASVSCLWWFSGWTVVGSYGMKVETDWLETHSCVGVGGTCNPIFDKARSWKLARAREIYAGPFHHSGNRENFLPMIRQAGVDMGKWHQRRMNTSTLQSGLLPMSRLWKNSQGVVIKNILESQAWTSSAYTSWMATSLVNSGVFSGVGKWYNTKRYNTDEQEDNKPFHSIGRVWCWVLKRFTMRAIVMAGKLFLAPVRSSSRRIAIVE